MIREREWDGNKLCCPIDAFFFLSIQLYRIVLFCRLLASCKSHEIEVGVSAG